MSGPTVAMNEMTLRKLAAATLRRRGWSYAQLAIGAGVSAQRIGQWLRASGTWAAKPMRKGQKTKRCHQCGEPQTRDALRAAWADVVQNHARDRGDA